jgi:hypothetical protein
VLSPPHWHESPTILQALARFCSNSQENARLTLRNWLSSVFRKSFYRLGRKQNITDVSELGFVSIIFTPTLLNITSNNPG